MLHAVLHVITLALLLAKCGRPLAHGLLLSGSMAKGAEYARWALRVRRCKGSPVLFLSLYPLADANARSVDTERDAGGDGKERGGG